MLCTQRLPMYTFQLSLKEACKSFRKDRSSNFIFSELLKKATTAETVTETEKNYKTVTGKFSKTETKLKLENLC